METPERRNEKSKSPVFLEPDEIALIKHLVENKKCSSAMISKLTGMNPNSCGGFYRDHDITSPGGKPLHVRGKNTKISRIQEARKAALLNAEYGETLSKIRAKYEVSRA